MLAKIHELEIDEQSRMISEEALPLYVHIRSLSDRAETLIAKDIWPYPTYTRLLNIS